TTDGFDGLASFSPDGQTLKWTSNRGGGGQSQIFVAKWDHGAALKSLGLEEASPVAVAAKVGPAEPASAGTESARQSSGEITEGDLIRHVDYLCRPELEGRLTGTPGEQMATAYAAAFMDQIGLQPAGDHGTFFQDFEFTAGVSLGTKNRLSAGDANYEIDRDWRPLAFSTTGTIPESPVVFAGYGVVAPADEDQPEYDSFVHLDVKDKWVLALRYLPENIEAERRQHLARFSSARFKAMTARDRGARGLILVSGPETKVKDELVPLRFDGSMGNSALPVISVSNRLAGEWLKAVGKDLGELQRGLDTGEPQMGFVVDGRTIQADIDIDHVKRTGRNVLGRLSSAVPGAAMHRSLVVLGAHIDHLGRGGGGNSLAREEERDQIHFGADDNASGVACVLEVAQDLVASARNTEFPLERDLLVACWSGEELGLLGSAHFVKAFAVPADGAEGSHPPSEALYPQIAACVNLDMVGRLQKKLVLQGISSSSIWKGEIERRNVAIGLPLTLQGDGYLPTDATSFYTRGVPILSAFTGSHGEYHTPRDTPDTLNYSAAVDVARLMGLITRSLLTREDIPDFVEPTRSAQEQPRAYLRAYLGTIPDYSETERSGVLLSGVAKDGPAAQGGVSGGDLIVELAGKKIANIYDYTYAIEALQVGQVVTVVVERKGERVSLKVTPGSRE
ncbi:MAG TPA: M28 family peptidase, partial [Pirellulaceae bacterium]